MWDYDPDLVIVASSVGSVNITPLPIKKFTYTSCEPSEVGTDLLPICRICQLPGDKEDSLFSPCRCSGSVRYIHQSCLKVSKLPVVHLFEFSFQLQVQKHSTGSTFVIC